LKSICVRNGDNTPWIFGWVIIESETDNENEMKEIEIKQLDLRFESFRMKDARREEVIFVSIAQRGIQEALLCVGASLDSSILLDGFKRFRCARRLGINVLPVEELGKSEADGLIRFLRRVFGKPIHVLEEARLVDELKEQHGMSLSEIARHLERSSSWVSLRIGILETMGPVIREAIFDGRFPARVYLYILKPFTRVNTISRKRVEQFVLSIAGKGLSYREIELLAHAYFRGGATLREQIEQGQLDWTLNQLKREKEFCASPDLPLNETEHKVLGLLEQNACLIRRLPYDLKDQRLHSPIFWSEARKFSESILRLWPPLISRLKSLQYDS